MSRTILIALLVLLGVFAVSVFAVDTEISLQSTSSEVTPELADSLASVHDAINEAEAAIAEEEMMYGEGDEAMFLEMQEHMEADGESDADADSEAETEMEESLGLDADTEGEALFFEMGADLYAEAEMDAEDDAEFDAESDVEVEHETDAEFGSVIVHEAEAGHEQNADPIVTEQMETDAALKDFGFLEADADADADAETEADAEAETEAEAEAGEEQTAVTKCGKKITWERNQEPQPEVPQAAEPAPVQA